MARRLEAKRSVACAAYVARAPTNFRSLICHFAIFLSYLLGEQSRLISLRIYRARKAWRNVPWHPAVGKWHRKMFPL
jgi:hypothetical protein